MFFLMVEIDGVITRIGRKARKESAAISNAMKLYQEGYRDKTVSYVEVWESANADRRGSKMAWSTQLAGV